MTREEAIKRLNVWLKCANCPEDKQCYDKYLHTICEDYDYGEEVSIEEAMMMAIEALEQEPKTGHNCNEDYADCDQFVCSECGIELQDWHRVERDEDDGDISYHDHVFRFCPNCGAKMQKVKE